MTGPIQVTYTRSCLLCHQASPPSATYTGPAGWERTHRKTTGHDAWVEHTRPVHTGNRRT